VPNSEFANDKPEIQELADKVASWAMPGEQVEAYVSRSRSTKVKVRDGEVEEFTSEEPAGIGIRVIVGHKQGFASAGALDEVVAKETLEEARDNLTFAQDDEWVGLAEDDGVAYPDLDLYREELESLATETKIEWAKEIERKALSADPRIARSYSAGWNDSFGESAIANSLGLSRWGRSSGCSLGVGVLAEGDGQTQVGGGYTFGRSQADINMDEAVEEAVSESVRMLGATKPRSAKLPAIFMPDITSSFLSVISSALNGESVLRGRSVFAERVGEQVASSIVTLVDDPTDPESTGAAKADGEGLASRRTVLVESGNLERFLQNTWSGRRSGQGSTASAVRGYSSTPSVGARALSLVPGRKSQEELIREIGNGVLIQTVSGLHSGVSTVSGDFSVGAAGLMIRDGELAEPVQEMTIASTLQRLLLDVAAVGGDQQWRFGPAGVSLVIGEVSLGGI
jgi:PmbA protein